MILRLCLLVGFVLPGCVEPGIGADPRWGRPDAIQPKAEWMVLTPAFRILPPEIAEASGLARLGGSYFVHNDSGDPARVFRATRLDFADFEELPAPGAQAIDWEEITTFRGDLLVCDTGNNRGTRDDVMLYRYSYVHGSKEETPATRAPLPGSARSSGRLELRARYPVRYADGPHDVEAAFAIDDSLYLVTKDRGEGTWVLRFDELRDESALSAGAANVPVRVAMLDLGGEQVTAATYDARHDVVILLAYSGISVYPARRLEGSPARTTRIWARQAEAICVQGDSLVFANEQRDVFVVEDFVENPRDEALPPPGEGTLRSVSTDSTDPARAGGSTSSTHSARPALPAVVSGVRIDGDSSEWSAEASSLPLRNALPGESFRWLKLDDRLLVDARVCVVASPEEADPESLRTGSGLLLSFADTDSRSTFLDGSQTQLFFEAAPASSSQAWRLSFRGYDLSSMTRVNGSVIAASLGHPSISASGWFEFEAALPAAAIWPDRPIPETFLFDIQGIGLREGEEVHFSAADLYSIYRPYAWGNIALIR